MFTLFTLAYLLAAPWPQEKQETPPSGTSKEAVRDLIGSAKPVKGERTTPAGPPLSQKDLGGKSGAASNVNRASVAPKADVADKHVNDADEYSHATNINDVNEKISAIFVENALYQQELANRNKVISVEDITTPEAALAELKAGNSRFIKGGRVRTLMTAQDKELRATLAKKQAPFAVVVTCSDSRAMDNLIFDQELGRVFSIRAAGNSPDTLGIASIELRRGWSSCGRQGRAAWRSSVHFPASHGRIAGNHT